MKERLKELGYWIEDKLKDLCGEITPDKRITVILIMLLILTIGNLYFTISTIYDWGKDSEKKEQSEIKRIEKPKSERNKDKHYDFMDSVIEKDLFDLQKQKMKQDSLDSININKQRFKKYERTIKNKYRPQTAA